MPNHVLWDIDGTLLANARCGGSLYDEAIRDVTGHESPGPRPAEHGKVDGQVVAERLAEYGLPEHLHGPVSRRLDQLAGIRHLGDDRRRLLPGAREALEAVAQAGWRNSLLTGNSPARARAKFAGSGLPAELVDWDTSFFGGEARARHEVTAQAAQRLAGAASVIVGDTPSDDEAAAAAGIPFIAVATGIFDEARLRATSAVLVLPDLVTGLADLLGWLDAATRRTAGSGAGR